MDADYAVSRNADAAGTGRAAILAVSYGTCRNDSRKAAIYAVEKKIADSFPQYEVREAFTSQVMIDRLKERCGLKTDNVKEALDRALEDKITTLVIQPTHLTAGHEYANLADALKAYEDKFEQAVLAAPLLAGDADLEALMKAITEKTAGYDDGKTAVCLAGHGTGAEAGSVYVKMQDKLMEAGFTDYYVGTLKSEPSLEDVLAALKNNGGCQRAVLMPLMLAAGSHAHHDLAGSGADSWKSILEKEGYEVECILEGLGEIPAVRDIYVRHVQAAVDKIGETARYGELLCAAK